MESKYKVGDIVIIKSREELYFIGGHTYSYINSFDKKFYKILKVEYSYYDIYRYCVNENKGHYKLYDNCIKFKVNASYKLKKLKAIL
jgi:hypothetical protein